MRKCNTKPNSDKNLFFSGISTIPAPPGRPHGKDLKRGWFHTADFAYTGMGNAAPSARAAAERPGFMSKPKHPLSRAFNVQSAFFIPLWRRVAVVGFTALWALFELSNNAPTWALCFAGIAAYLAYQFFVVFNPDEED